MSLCHCLICGLSWLWHVPRKVEDGAKLVRSLQQWLESLVLVSTFLVSFWAVKGVNVIEKAGFPVSK